MKQDCPTCGKPVAITATGRLAAHNARKTSLYCSGSRRQVRPAPRRQTEAQFQAAVIELAQLTGWLVAHFRPAQTSKGWRTAVSGDGAGFPDLVLVHPRRGLVLYRELKRGPSRKLRPDQQAWQNALQSAGADADTWIPADWPTIEHLLKGS